MKPVTSGEEFIGEYQISRHTSPAAGGGQSTTQHHLLYLTRNARPLFAYDYDYDYENLPR